MSNLNSVDHSYAQADPPSKKSSVDKYKSSSDCDEERHDDDGDADVIRDICPFVFLNASLDDFVLSQRTNDVNHQVKIISACIAHPDPTLRWRALWSIEDRHDALLDRLRRKHFHRWPRQKFPRNDPYRDSNPNSKAIYFPGKDASHEAKCAWSGVVIEECAGNESMPVWDRSWPRDTDIPTLDEVGPTVIADIMFACAPEKVSVCLYVPKTMIDYFLAAVVIVEEPERKPVTGRFMSNMDLEAQRRGSEAKERERELKRRNPGLDSIESLLSSPYIRSDSPDDVRLNIEEKNTVDDSVMMTKLAKFKHWLKEEATSGGTLHQESHLTKLPPARENQLIPFKRFSLSMKEEETLVLLARRDDVTKDACTNKVLDDMLASLGVRDDIVTVQPQGSRNPDVHSYAFFPLREEIGGHINYPDGEDENGNKRTSVAFTWSNTEILTEKHNQGRRFEQAFETDFVRDVKVKKDASGGRSSYILWPKEPDQNGSFCRDTTTAVISANSYIIWLPGDYNIVYEKIYNICINGKDEEKVLPTPMLYVTDTNTGNLFWDRVLAYFDDEIKGINASSDLLQRYGTIPNKHSLQLCQLLALTCTLDQADELIMDHEHGLENIAEFFSKFSKCWQRALRKDDDTLGLGLSNASTNAEGFLDSPVASREGLDAMLKFYANKIEDCYAEYAFDTEIRFDPFSRR
mmetsp:Transcript_38358/g.44696  ORF Transcript_38358/g.44696 Transcript_38358/m.44696 type:complete len:690 (-) Transcript_38358:118-2187(-)